MSRPKTEKIEIYKSEFLNWVLVIKNKYGAILLKEAGFHSKETALEFLNTLRHG